MNQGLDLLGIQKKCPGGMTGLRAHMLGSSQVCFSKCMSHFFYNLKNNLKNPLDVYSLKIRHCGFLEKQRSQGFLNDYFL